MAGFGGVHEEGRRAGGGEGGGDLARHMAGLAEPGDDDAALGVADDFGGGGKRRAEIGLQGRGQIAATPLASASSVRKAEATAAFAGSVPDDLVISGFGLAMSGSEGDGGIGSAPGILLSTARSAMRRAAPGSQRLINHNCFNSINDVFRAGSG